MAIDFEAVLRYSRELQRAGSLEQLLEAARSAVLGSTRYTNVGFGVLENGPDGEQVRMLGVAGAAHRLIFAHPPTFLVAESDEMMKEIITGRKPVVVVDARVDPRTNKELVARYQNRTLINIPLVVGENVIGALNVGTYGEEPCIAPTDDELEILTIFAIQFAAALDRVRLLGREREAVAEREALRERLHKVERIETLALVAGGVAHDFNNLLTVILNSLYFLKDARLEPEAASDVADATEAANRARDLTRQLLAMGRRQPLRLGPISWGRKLRELTRLLARLLPETIQVVLEDSPGLPDVLADTSQLDQVVMNLCINARDAMPSGGRLTLRTRPGVLVPSGESLMARPGPAVVLEVADTGHGMPPEVVNRIFEPFFTTKGVGRGTGLGLAIALGIVDQHGGRLECRSVVGEGTTFTVTLPVAAGHESAEPPPVPVKRAGGQERVLAAEDDPAIRELLQRILRDAGYELTIVSDGCAAVDAAKAYPFDLVLLDAVMPLLSGREAFEHIHRLQPGVAWLFMTGHAADTLPPDFLTRHGIELIEKPWLPWQLLAAIRRALERGAIAAA